MESYKKDLELEQQTHKQLEMCVYPRLRYDSVGYACNTWIFDKNEQHKDKDVFLTMQDGKRFSISEKARYKNYGDILIEIIKNNVILRNSKKDGYGWGLNSEADYIVYCMGANRVVILDNTNGILVNTIHNLLRRNNDVFVGTVNKYKNEYRGIRDNMAFDSCDVTLTGALNKKDNNETYMTYSICFPVCFFKNENLLVYDGELNGNAIELNISKKQESSKKSLF